MATSSAVARLSGTIMLTTAGRFHLRLCIKTFVCRLRCIKLTRRDAMAPVEAHASNQRFSAESVRAVTNSHRFLHVHRAAPY